MYRRDWFDKFMDVSLKTFIFLLFAGFWIMLAGSILMVFVFLAAMALQ